MAKYLFGSTVPGLAPNGIHIDNETGKMIVGFWGAVMEGWGTPELSGSLKSIDLNTKQLKDLGKKPIGNLDGIESDGKRFLLCNGLE